MAFEVLSLKFFTNPARVDDGLTTYYPRARIKAGG
jgi:hypothetical protein